MDDLETFVQGFVHNFACAALACDTTRVERCSKTKTKLRHDENFEKQEFLLKTHSSFEP